MEGTGDGGGGKREPSDDGRGDGEVPNKRPRSSGGRAVDVRFLLQSRNADAIIGEGGANINSLREEFEAGISVPDCPGPERILSIVADLDTLGEILASIIPKMHQANHRQDENSREEFRLSRVQHTSATFDSTVQPKPRLKTRSRHPKIAKALSIRCGTEAAQAVQSEMRLLIHREHVVGIVKSRIKELRKSTEAKIEVKQSCCPCSTEHIVRVMGSPSVVVDCIKRIWHIIAKAPVKGLNKLYDPHNFDPDFAQEYGGFSERDFQQPFRGTGARGGYSGRGSYNGR